MPTVDTAAIIYRLGYLLKTQQVEDAADVGLRIHTLARSINSMRSRERPDEPDDELLGAFHLVLWAVPGMPQVHAPRRTRAMRSRAL